MNQNQTQRQSANNNDFIMDADESTPPAPLGSSGSGSDKVQESLSSYINTQLSYNKENRQRVSDNCIPERRDITSSCLLGFLNCCDNYNLLFGPYCQAHNSLLFNRRFVSTTNDLTNPITSAGNSSMECFSTMFLTSTLPGRVTEDDISYSLSPVTRNMDGTSHNNVIKFFTLLSTPEEFWNQDSYMNTFKKYIVDVSQGYFQYVNQHSQIIDKCIIPVCVSPAFFARIQTSRFWQKVFKMVRDNDLVAIAHTYDGSDVPPLDYNTTGKVTYHIPLSMFNILDILTILSFNFDIRYGCVGYLPNAMVYDGTIVLGTATGLHNTFKTAKNRVNFCAYPPNVNKLLGEAFSTPNHNLDYIIFTVEPAVETADALHTLAICERKNIVPRDLYLEKITRNMK